MFVSLIRFLLNPFNVFWLLLAFCLIAWWFRREREAKWLVILTAGWFLITSTPFVPVMVVNSLEDRYEPLYVEQLENPEAEFHILVHGGGHGFDDRLPPNSLLSTQAMMRLAEGIRLHRQLPNSKLVLSGFSASGRTTQAEMLQKTAILMGVDEARTILQKVPGNTYEEAQVYANSFGNDYPLIIVTSATHMPRAMMMFKLFEIEPVPSPTHYRLKGSWKQKKIGLPSMRNMELLRIGLSEYAAMSRYGL